MNIKKRSRSAHLQRSRHGVARRQEPWRQRNAPRARWQQRPGAPQNGVRENIPKHCCVYADFRPFRTQRNAQSIPWKNVVGVETDFVGETERVTHRYNLNQIPVCAQGIVISENLAEKRYDCQTD